MKIIKYTFVLALVVSFTSCKRWIETDASVTNPNAGVGATSEIILRHMMVAAIQANEGNNARYANMFTQHFRGLARQHAGYDSYIMNSQNFQWGLEYQQIIHQGKLVIEMSQSNRHQQGVTKIIQAWTFGNLTSLYGNIPFTEADQFETIKEPKFDDQMTVVYPGIQALLDEAIADLEATGNIEGDIYLGGDAAKWIAVANTLKARYYLHVKDYANALTAANKGISATGNDVVATHNGTTQSGRNLWNDFLALQRTTDYGATGSFLEAFIKTGGAKNNAKTNESARYADIFAINDDGNLDINFFGTSSLFSPTSSFPLITYRENMLIMAEANARLGNDAAALTALNSVRQSLAAQYTTGTYTDYVAADFATNADLITEVVRERYVTLVGQIEVFNDLRRTQNAIGITPATGTTLPGRFLYPNAEAQSNTNTPTGVTLFDVLPVFQ